MDILKILLVRHGQTDWNLEQRFQGHSDMPLNEVGRRQAHALADRLSALPIDIIYSGDLKRALETSTIISEGKNEIKVDARLRELNFGDWEGSTYDEIKENYSDALAAWESDVYNNAPPNGETLEQLVKRVQSVLDELCEKHISQNVLIVAHGGVLQILICLALKLKPTMYWQFCISPASVSEIVFYPAGAIMNFLNDTSHLSHLLLETG